LLFRFGFNDRISRFSYFLFKLVNLGVSTSLLDLYRDLGGWLLIHSFLIPQKSHKLADLGMGFILPSLLSGLDKYFNAI
jgi:hypothetical protein